MWSKLGRRLLDDLPIFWYLSSRSGPTVLDELDAQEARLFDDCATVEPPPVPTGMEDPFLPRVREHLTEVRRCGQIAWGSLLFAAGAFALFVVHFDAGGWWWLCFAISVAYFARASLNFEARRSHQLSADLAAIYSAGFTRRKTASHR